jgi:hypothetical protein
VHGSNTVWFALGIILIKCIEVPSSHVRIVSCQTMRWPLWLESSWFSYSLTRDVSLRPVTQRHFNIAFLILGLGYIVLITLINVVAVGYEPISVITTNFNITTLLWYEFHFLPKTSLLPETRTCNATLMKVNDG